MAHDSIRKDLADTVPNVAEVQGLDGRLLINHGFVQIVRFVRCLGQDGIRNERVTKADFLAEGGHNFSREGVHPGHEVINGRAQVGADVSFRS